jgi:hypothetical protein
MQVEVADLKRQLEAAQRSLDEDEVGFPLPLVSFAHN